MPRKLTIEFVREQFEKEGYILLSEEYKGCDEQLKYICPKKHVGIMCWHSWKSGHRCLDCSGKKKYTIEFIRKQFKKENYILLSTKYNGAHEKLEYICPKQHEGKTSWHRWQQGQRCKKCWYNRNRGKTHYNWNNDLANEDRQNRCFVLGYRDWTYQVKKRDNFTCQICGDNIGGNLVSHHLESYNNNPKLRTELNNGVCLCENCHKDFHHQYGNGNNTKKQFNKFLKDKIV